jgi:hypothetical protein
MDESGGENGTGGTNRMSMGHRGTLHIDDLELQPELPRDYDGNRREGFVDLEALDRPNVPVGALERLTILLVTVRPT